MKHCIATLVILLGFVTASPAQQPKQPVTKDIARSAIAIFREEPASERGRGAAAIILRFADESRDVEIVISPSALPWLATKPAPKYSDTLLAAYMAGTIRSQLDSGATKNDPVAGTEQVIETYQKLKKTDPSLRVAEVEKLVELKARGQLNRPINPK